MTAIDSDFGFDAVFRKSAAELKLRLASDAALDDAPAAGGHRGGAAIWSVFASLGMLSLAMLTIGYLALLSDTPEIWIHRLVALAITQSALIGIVAMKLLPLIERQRSLITIRTGDDRSIPSIEAPRKSSPARIEPLPPPLPEPRKPVIGGQLAGRDYLEYDDGSIEIDTLVGRRRFVSIEAARDFVGS